MPRPQPVKTHFSSAIFLGGAAVTLGAVSIAVALIFSAQALVRSGTLPGQLHLFKFITDLDTKTSAWIAGGVGAGAIALLAAGAAGLSRSQNKKAPETSLQGQHPAGVRPLAHSSTHREQYTPPEERGRLFEETLARCKLTTELADTQHAIDESTVIIIRPEAFTRPANEEFGTTNIAIKNGDAFVLAHELGQKTDGRRVCVLNMANAYSIGGGVKIGCQAQEEDLCLKSNLYIALQKYAARWLLEDGREQYKGRAQLIGTGTGRHVTEDTTLRIIHSGSIKVFGDKIGVTKAKDFKVGVISAAAFKRNGAGKNTFKSEKVYLEKTKQLIRQILRTAYEQGHKDLVLGAIGCGAFGNDPDVIAAIYANLLNTEFAGLFTNVIFGIMATTDTTSPNYKRDHHNLERFKAVFMESGV